MTVWCHLPTIFNRRHVLRIAGLLLLCVALTTTLLLSAYTHAVAGVNQTLSFQGRLLRSDGSVVPDGHYNMQFKIYQDGNSSGTGSTLKWTESYVTNNANAGVTVTNGFFSVTLGELNPFGTQVDWNQDTLWLSMNIAGSAADCTTFNSGTCVADGEMTPMKRITSTPYALNSGMLGGKTANNFLQLAQGVQTDASTNTSSIFVNKTGSGNLLQLQSGSVDAFTLTNAGDITFGTNANHSISVGTAGTGTAGNNLSVSAGTGGSGSGSAGGTLSLQGGNAGGTNGNAGGVTIDTGTATGSGTLGTLALGTTNAGAISIGQASGGSQTISIGNGTSTGTTTVAGGTTNIQSKNDTTVTTNGTQQARFSGSGNILYLGNANGSGQATTANNYTIQATSSTGSNVQGGGLTLQAGSATNGNANGGNLTLSGGSGVGTGATGLVVVGTPAFQTAGLQTCATNCSINTSTVDSNGVALIKASAASLTVTLGNPTITTAGRIIYITATSDSNDFTLSINGGGSGNLTPMRKNSTATLIWSGTYWTVAGASNSTTLQSAYDNTLQSAGGAELVVGKTANTNGLTIRDSTTNSVNGNLLQVQSKTSANLFSVSSNVSDYASNNGAETDNGSGGFPSNTWAAKDGNTTVTRNTTTTDNSIATGKASVQVVTANSTANTGVTNQIVDPADGVTAKALNANTLYNVSFSARLPQGASTFNDMKIYYQYDSSSTILCADKQTVAQTTWTKINCTFTAPASGITSANKIRIEQATGVNRTFYIDNLSVTLAASQNYASDPGVDSALGTNWVAAGGSATRATDNGYDKSDSAKITTAGSTTDGIKNNLAVNPIPSNNYRVSVQVQTQVTALTNFTISYNNGASTTNCVDYNTQSVSISSSAWTKVTCIIQVPAGVPSSPYLTFAQGDTSTRTASLFVDSLSFTIANSTTPDVQIGSGTSGGPVTLFTLDSAASAPIEADNSSLFGSMYYDTTLGKIQCYQQSGWGSCGAAPDNIITISPEYTNAVMHGPSGGTAGVGTMTSDLCSDSLDINDATHGTPICGTNETRNFYNWTSPQTASGQIYAIYVTYQLPSTFKQFASGQTSVKALSNNGSSGGSASVSYKVYRSNKDSGLTPCGSAVSVATSGNAGTWQTGAANGTADPSTCGFAAGDSIVFEIDMSAYKNANAYVSDIGFTFSNK